MVNGLVASGGINFFLVFIEGILSFFSPCVIPLIPVYISYLAGNAKQVREDGTVFYKRSKVFLHTLFFVLGISFAFFILGLSFSALGSFFNDNKLLFTRIGGVLIVILGLIQLGVFNLSFLNRDRRLNININPERMNPVIAFVMGFTFSFAWTPCVGPALASVLILASNAKSAMTGNMLVLVYSVGFVIPFLLLGLFTTQVLNFINSKKNLLKYTIKAGGILLIAIGLMTFTGFYDKVSGYLSSFGGSSQPPAQEQEKEPETPPADEGGDVTEGDSEKDGADSTDADEKMPAPDFTLTDQYGNSHTLSDYKGKTVFLNFWGTWCPPCRMEMPDIEELYNEYNQNQDDIIILGVSHPGLGNETDVDGVKEFLAENEYTYPVVFDEVGTTLGNYSINAFPTTFMIDTDGNIFGYVSGMLSKDVMENIIQQTVDSQKQE